jgi:hypothetical protein
MAIPDVDIDVVTRDKVLELFPDAVRASQMTTDGRKLVSHNTGVYFQNLPQDPLLGVTTFPYDIAEDLGYYKVDFIPFHIYEHADSDKHIQEMVTFAESVEFPWEWFTERMFFENNEPKLKLTHIGNYYDLCQAYPPTSVMDVAILIALIRPRKKYLIGEDWVDICEKIWKKLPEENSDGSGNYFFKKSHAVGYALAVLVHMQLLEDIL